MKMLVAIVNITEAGNVNKALNEAGIKATRMNTIGAFFKGKNETFLIGLNDEKVPETINIIESSIPKKRRKKVVVTDDKKFEDINKHKSMANVTMFILDVAMFMKI